MSRKPLAPLAPPLHAILARARRDSGISLSELARRVGVSAGYLSRIERGEGDRAPGEALIGRLARALGVSLDALLTSSGRVPPDIHEWLLESAWNVAAVRSIMARAA